MGKYKLFSCMVCNQLYKKKLKKGFIEPVSSDFLCLPCKTKIEESKGKLYTVCEFEPDYEECAKEYIKFKNSKI